MICLASLLVKSSDIEWLENPVAIAALKDIEGAEKMLQVMTIVRDDVQGCLVLLCDDDALKTMAEREPDDMQKALWFLGDVRRYSDWPQTSALVQALDKHSWTLLSFPPESRELRVRVLIAMRNIALQLEKSTQQDTHISNAIKILRRRSEHLIERTKDISP